MALASTNFIAVQKAMVEEDFRQRLDLLNLITNSARSQDVLRKATEGQPAGGFATSIAIPAFDSSTSVPATTASIFSSYPQTAEALGGNYANLTDTTVNILLNRSAHNQFQLPDLHAQNHILGYSLIDQGLKDCAYKIRTSVATLAFSDLYASGSALSGTGGTRVNFDLDTSSTANMLPDMVALAGVANQQNWSNDRWLVLNTDVMGSFLNAGGAPLASVDYAQGSGNSTINGTVQRFYGFNLIFDNCVVSGQGIAFDPSKFVFAAPLGIEVEQMRDPDAWNTLSRMRYRYGFKSVGKTTTGFSAGAPTTNGAHEGIARITVV